MSTFIEAVMALKNAAHEAILDHPAALRDSALSAALEHPELFDDALCDLDEAHARELARVELDARMEERRAVLRALPKIVKKFIPEDDVMLSMRMNEYCYGYFGGGEHRQSDPVPIIEPGPACSERGKECCK